MIRLRGAFAFAFLFCLGDFCSDLGASPTRLDLEGLEPGDVHDPIADSIYVNPALGAFNQGLFLNFRPRYFYEGQDNPGDLGDKTKVDSGAYLNGMYSPVDFLGFISHGAVGYAYSYDRYGTNPFDRVARSNQLAVVGGGGLWVKVDSIAIGTAAFGASRDYYLDEGTYAPASGRFVTGVAFELFGIFYAYSLELFSNHDSWIESAGLAQNGERFITSQYLPKWSFFNHLLARMEITNHWSLSLNLPFYVHDNNYAASPALMFGYRKGPLSLRTGWHYEEQAMPPAATNIRYLTDRRFFRQRATWPLSIGFFIFKEFEVILSLSMISYNHVRHPQLPYSDIRYEIYKNLDFLGRPDVGFSWRPTEFFVIDLIVSRENEIEYSEHEVKTFGVRLDFACTYAVPRSTPKPASQLSR